MNKKQVKQFLKKEQLQPIKKLGQNFLIHPLPIQKIIQALKNHPTPYLEIGPGLGALTRHFENNKKDLILVERDKKLSAYWEDQGWSVLSTDALKMNWETLPKKITLFGNLPYEIAASLILQASLRQKQIQAMLFMMQKEVAKRVTAKPKTKDYSLLSVISQVCWNIYPLMDVPPNNFYPRPKVDGRILEFQIRKKKQHLEASAFLQFVKKCFSLRRKMLFKQLSEAGIISKQKAKAMLEDLTLPQSCRVGEVSPEQFVQLFLQLKNPPDPNSI